MPNGHHDYERIPPLILDDVLEDDTPAPTEGIPVLEDESDPNAEIPVLAEVPEDGQPFAASEDEIPMLAAQADSPAKFLVDAEALDAAPPFAVPEDEIPVLLEIDDDLPTLAEPDAAFAAPVPEFDEALLNRLHVQLADATTELAEELLREEWASAQARLFSRVLKRLHEELPGLVKSVVSEQIEQHYGPDEDTH